MVILQAVGQKTCYSFSIFMAELLISKMKKENAIKIFDQKQVRTHWDEGKELWYISVIDVIEVLTGTDRPRKYWNDLKTKLKKEGSELSEKIGQLKMQSSDGKTRPKIGLQ